MPSAPAYPLSAPQGGFSLTRPLVRIRDWLDARGKPAWIAALIAGFVLAWPVGLAILGYMIWSDRMFTCRKSRHMNPTRPTGNLAFDAYREETLKRLEDEHAAFLDFLGKLREAKDKAEFDQFMQDRRQA